MKKYKLYFEIVPDECWRGNLRSLLAPADWDKIRKSAYARAGYKCSVCGARGRLEAHERWHYDEKKKLQKLVGVDALCSRCHEVTHISRAYLVGRGAEAMEWFMRVNGCSQAEYHEALQEANEEHARRNKIEEWTTDMQEWLQNNLYRSSKK